MEELQELFGNSSNRISKSVGSMVYDIDYCGIIGEASDYLEDFKIYRQASENDLIRIRINSDGGNFNTLAQIIANMKSCQAPIMGFLEGSANSAGGALFLQCDSYVVSDNCEMLIHESTLGAYDSSYKAHKQFIFSLERIKQAFEEWYKDFLTTEEMDKVLQGDDVWLKSEEIVKRLEVKCAVDNVSPPLDLDSMTKKEIQGVCQLYGIEFTNKETKTELINKINEKS